MPHRIVNCVEEDVQYWHKPALNMALIVVPYGIDDITFHVHFFLLQGSNFLSSEVDII